MGRKQNVYNRSRAEKQKMKMRERRAAMASSSTSNNFDAAALIGLGEPFLSEEKSPNALRLATPQRSLSTHDKGVPLRSDSPPCVCTPPSVPPPPCGAGQTNTTDSVQTVCTSPKVPLQTSSAVVIGFETKVAWNYESRNKKRNENQKQTCDKTVNDTDKITKNNTEHNVGTMNYNKSDQTSQKVIEIESKAKIESTEMQQYSDATDNCMLDVLFLKKTSLEVYKFTPLCLKSREKIAKCFKLTINAGPFDEVCKKGKITRPGLVQPIVGDGNCFFRALSFAISHTEQHHKILRKQIVHHMLMNSDAYNSHLRSGEKSVSNYILENCMLHDGVWATEVEILAAADLFNVNIYVYEEVCSSWLKFSPGQVRECNVVEEGIYLVHKFEAHYDVVVDIEEHAETLAGNKQNICDLPSVDSHKSPKAVCFDLPIPVQGHFDQSHPNFKENAGKQCVMNSLSALIYSQEKPTNSWVSHDMDKILLNGNELYKFLQRSSTIHSDFIAIHEIPRALEYNGKMYEFAFHESVMGTLGNIGISLDELQFFTLNEALYITLLQKCDGAFVTFKGNTFVIIKQNNLYCIFDSHSRSLKGTLDPNGSSIKIHYSDIIDVYQHCLQLAESMAYRPDDMFEVTAVEVSKGKLFEECREQSCSDAMEVTNRSTAGDISHRLELYFQDQENRKLLKQNKFTKEDSPSFSVRSRKEYMRTYMRKMRNSSKRNILLEADRKRKIIIREKEPEKHRAVDLKSKIKAREKEPEKHKATDLKSKVKAREKEPEKFRAADLKSKKKARETDPIKHRAVDLKSKIKAREKEPEKHKATDLKSKIKAKEREPEKHKAANLKSKIKGREKEPEKFRAVDFKSKKKARETDPIKHRAVDLKSKIKAREKEPEKLKAIDLKSKRKSRFDSGILEKERLTKKQARQDPAFLQEEAKLDLERKRELRQDCFFLENERLKQAERRKHTTQQLKTLDRKRKADDRMSTRYIQDECNQYKRRRFGSNIEECINIFHTKTERGPEYVCTCCHQIWFKESVTKTYPIPAFSRYKDFYTGYKSVSGKEWICHTCISALKRCKVPKLSVMNGMKWPQKPPELDLHPLEERLIALRIPFMQIRELPRGGQYSVKGNVVNVPIDIQPTVNALPRQMDENFTVAVKLKKRLSNKSCVFSENVRPSAVLTALHWLMNNSNLYKESGVNVDENWVVNTTESAEEIVQEFIGTQKQSLSSSDRNHYSSEIGKFLKENDTESRSENPAGKQDMFIEVPEDEYIQGNSDTLIDEADLDTNKVLVLAPGEDQLPISLYQDKDAEILSFPTLYCGQKRLENSERDTAVSYSDVAKWELRSVDRRAAKCVPNIFFKLNKIQRKQVADKVTLAIRRKKDGQKITAREARNPELGEKVVSLNEGYYIFRTLRNSPAYLSSRKKDVFAMIRQLGLPTWFMSLSSADTKWTELLKTLAVLSGKSFSDEEIEKMTWSEKVTLVQKDPVTCCRYFDHRVQIFMNTVLKSEHAPIGIVTDTFQRIEFQNRGSPHVHMMIWTENAPKYSFNTVIDIIQYVDSHITCSLDVDEDIQELAQMQVHKHSKTCKKGGRSICRFGFPLPPLRDTTLLEPLEIDIEKYRILYAEIHARMNEYKDGCDMSYEEFLQSVAKIDEDEYLKCIRSSLKGPKIFLKRKPSEMRVNYYNKTVLRAWKANLDLQFILDPYACAMYIVSYISKSQRGMSSMLEQASKEAAEGNMDLRRQVRHIGNKFLNFVEISAQEASYLVLQMPLTRASREVVFINTSPSDQRVFLLKSKEELENLPDNSTDIQCDNFIKRYSKRPKQLQSYCLADYVSELEVKNKHKEHIPENDCNEDDMKDPVAVDNDSESESDIDFSDSRIVLKLRGGLTIRKRKNPRVIRCVRYNKNTNAENYYREKLLLYLPWRDEEKDLKNGYESYEEHFNARKHQILQIVQKYEHYVEELDTAQQQAEEDCISEFDTIAPNTEQVQAEDAEEIVSQSEDFIHYVPPEPSQGILDLGQDLNLPDVTMKTETRSLLLPDDEYMELLRSLNFQQREFFNHVMHWVSKKNEPLYAFLSGGAGVGKSVVIRALYQALYRLLNSKEGDDPDSIKILLTAFTGKAAYNINGVTIASAFHKKMFQNQQHMHSDELNTFRTTYKDLAVIIIDEISMVGNKLLAFIHERLTELTGIKRDFGGLSIIAVGDLYQLSPVADSWIFDDMKVALAKNLWKENFRMFELSEIMRQRDDLDFAQMLNRLRFNELLPEDKELIQSRIISPTSATYPRHALHLFTENKRVNNFNYTLIQELKTSKVNVHADTDVISPANINKETKTYLIKEMNKRENHSQTGNLHSVLKLAVGMTYDVTVNVDVQDGLTNGASGTLKQIEFKEVSQERPAIVWMIFTDENIGCKRRNQYKHLYHKEIDKTWTPIFETKRAFLYNRKTYERIQFPLSPAAAKTVHKAQGATVDQLVVDLSSSFKAPHIHYVALSRARRLADLHIIDFNEKALKVDGKVHKEMERLRSCPMKLCYTPLYTIENSHLKLMFHNARSLHKHIDEIRHEPNIKNADIVGIAESRLMSKDRHDKYHLPGFKVFRLDEIQFCNTRPSHGLAVYVKNDVVVKRYHSHTYSGVEYILIDAKIKENDVQVIYVYLTPKFKVQEFLKILRVCIHPIIDKHKSLFFLGDFNMNILDNPHSILQFMEREFSCTQIVSEPTTVNHTLIDHIYTNENNVQSGVIPTYWSDHAMIFCTKEF